jgi:hypothetical protein
LSVKLDIFSQAGVQFYKKMKRIIICGVCGNIFLKYDCQITKTQKNNPCCSKKCAYKLRKKSNLPSGESLAHHGYILIRISNNKTRYKHRVVMEQYLGRKLNKNEIVHHKNGNKSDNRIENLELIMGNGTHIKEHIPMFKRNSLGIFST